MVILGGGAVSHERGTPVGVRVRARLTYPTPAEGFGGWGDAFVAGGEGCVIESLGVGLSI